MDLQETGLMVMEWVVASCAVPMRNVSWMLFQEGRSSNFS